MCGVPIERADDYLHRLIAKGHRVAVCEQLEDPAEAKKRGGKSVVRRDVVRLVTPGTITEERLLEPGRANILLAVQRGRPGEGRVVFGLAALDISTGAFSLGETDEAGLGPEIARIEPSEIVAPQALFDDPAFARLIGETGIAATPLAREALDAASAARLVEDFYGVDTLEGFGAFSRAEIAAAALALGYLKRTQIDALPRLERPSRRARGAGLEIDAATRANLELTRTLAGERAGSLLATIDLTATPAGARLIAERLASPLTDPAAIDERLDAVAFLVEAPPLRDALRKALAATPDFLRSLARLAVDRGGPRDLAALRDGLAASARIGATLDRDARPAGGAGALPRPARRRRGRAGARSRRDARRRTAAEEARRRLRARGRASPPLDEARRLRDESRRVVAEMQARYAEETGARQLKIKHNNFLGYYIETPQAQGEALLKAPMSATFIHRQTMAGRDALHHQRADRSRSAHRLGGRPGAGARARRVRAAAPAGAGRERDACAASARRWPRSTSPPRSPSSRSSASWSRPRVDDSLAFAIEGGRHPVVEAALAARGEPFVANDCDLSGALEDGGRLALVTGPNMAGKSTFLRQNALIAVLAQMGAFVPAKRAHIGVVDRLFSRVGAADDLARGRSTFMVEMVETAAILNQATRRSLVILDEIGRGTATFDGLSIAFACVEHLNAVNRSRALFATHFHELTQLALTLPRLFNLTMRVSEWKGALVFLHEVVPGAADRSYGIQVAKLAGLPPAVIKRARAVLAELEATRRAGAALSSLDALPLFSYEPPPPPGPDRLREALAKLDPDALTPREAQATLYELKRLAQEEKP